MITQALIRRKIYYYNVSGSLFLRFYSAVYPKVDMSKRNKLQKFAEVLSFPNVYENFDTGQPLLTAGHGATVDLRGRWAESHFGNSNPITLELACGRGEYTLGLALQSPQRNFIGVDIKGARIWKGASRALEHNIANAAFLRARIEHIECFFAPREVSEIWITFPDPFLRNSKANRRLTSAAFLDRYRKILQPGALIHLKTDEVQLYDFTLETLAAYPGADIKFHSSDIYAGELPVKALELKTYYEKQHLEAKKTIKYIQFAI